MTPPPKSCCGRTSTSKWAKVAWLRMETQHGRGQEMKAAADAVMAEGASQQARLDAGPRLARTLHHEWVEIDPGNPKASAIAVRIATASREELTRHIT